MSRSRWAGRSPRPAGRTFDRYEAEAIERGGTAERVYCTLRARFGAWPEDFLSIVRRCYAGRIPPRFEEIARRLERSRPWEVPEEPHGEPHTITIVGHDGAELARFSSDEVLP